MTSFNVTKDNYFNNLSITNTTKIPRYNNLAQIGDEPGYEGNIILDRGTGQFCWHDGVSWQCVSSGGGPGCPVVSISADVGTAQTVNCEFSIVGGQGISTIAAGDTVTITSTNSLSGISCFPPIPGEIDLVLNGVGPNFQIRNIASSFGLNLDAQPGGCLDISVIPEEFTLAGVGCSPPLSPANEINLVIEGLGPNFAISNLTSTFGLILEQTASGCVDIRVDPDIVGLTNLTGVGCSPPLSPTNEANLVLSGVGPNLEIRNLSSTFGLIFDPQPGGCLDIRVDPDIVGLTNLTGVGCSPPLSPDNQTNLVLSGVGPNLAIRNLSSTFGLIFDEQPDGCVDITVDPDLFGAENIGFGADVGPQNDRFIVYNGQPNLPDTLPLQIRTLYGAQNQAVVGLEAEDVIINDVATNPNPETNGNLIGTPIVQNLEIFIDTNTGNDANDGTTLATSVFSLGRALEIARFRNYVDQAVINITGGSSVIVNESMLNVKLGERGREQHPLVIRGQLEPVVIDTLQPANMTIQQTSGMLIASYLLPPPNILLGPSGYEGATIDLTWNNGADTRRFLMGDITNNSFQVALNVFLDNVDISQPVDFTIYGRTSRIIHFQTCVYQGDYSPIVFKDIDFSLNMGFAEIIEFNNVNVIWNNCRFTQTTDINALQFNQCSVSTFVNQTGQFFVLQGIQLYPPITNIPDVEGPAGLAVNVRRVNYINSTVNVLYSTSSAIENDEYGEHLIEDCRTLFALCLFTQRRVTNESDLTLIFVTIQAVVQALFCSFMKIAEIGDISVISIGGFIQCYYSISDLTITQNFTIYKTFNNSNLVLVESEHDCNQQPINILQSGDMCLTRAEGCVFRDIIENNSSSTALQIRDSKLIIILEDYSLIQNYTSNGQAVITCDNCEITISGAQQSQFPGYSVIDNITGVVNNIINLTSCRLYFNGNAGESDPNNYQSFVNCSTGIWPNITNQLNLVSCSCYIVNCKLWNDTNVSLLQGNFITGNNCTIYGRNWSTENTTVSPQVNSLFDIVMRLDACVVELESCEFNGQGPVQSQWFVISLNSKLLLSGVNIREFRSIIESTTSEHLLLNSTVTGSVGFGILCFNDKFTMYGGEIRQVNSYCINANENSMVSFVETNLVCESRNDALFRLNSSKLAVRNCSLDFAWRCFDAVNSSDLSVSGSQIISTQEFDDCVIRLDNNSTGYVDSLQTVAGNNLYRRRCLEITNNSVLSVMNMSFSNTIPAIDTDSTIFVSRGSKLTMQGCNVFDYNFIGIELEEGSELNVINGIQITGRKQLSVPETTDCSLLIRNGSVCNIGSDEGSPSIIIIGHNDGANASGIKIAGSQIHCRNAKLIITDNDLFGIQAFDTSPDIYGNSVITYENPSNNAMEIINCVGGIILKNCIFSVLNGLEFSGANTVSLIDATNSSVNVTNLTTNNNFNYPNGVRMFNSCLNLNNCELHNIENVYIESIKSIVNLITPNFDNLAANVPSTSLVRARDSTVNISLQESYEITLGSTVLNSFVMENSTFNFVGESGNVATLRNFVQTAIDCTNSIVNLKNVEINCVSVNVTPVVIGTNCMILRNCWGSISSQGEQVSLGFQNALQHGIILINSHVSIVSEFIDDSPLTASIFVSSNLQNGISCVNTNLSVIFSIIGQNGGNGISASENSNLRITQTKIDQNGQSGILCTRGSKLYYIENPAFVFINNTLYGIELLQNSTAVLEGLPSISGTAGNAFIGALGAGGYPGPGTTFFDYPTAGFQLCSITRV